MSRTVLNELKTFNINFEYEKEEVIEISNLLDEEKCLSFLQKQMIMMKAPNLSVAASMFSKRYAHLVVSSTLYSMIEFNCALNLPLEACSLSIDRKLFVQLDMCKWKEKGITRREQWREDVLRQLFSFHITPILNTLNKISNIPSSILWENVAIRINSIYRKILDKDLDQEKFERVNSDFYFLKNSGGDLFNLNDNSIRKYLKIGEEFRLNPKRKTCCMYYKIEKETEGIGYCSNCPLNSK